VAYNRSPAGKLKKKLRNAKRAFRCPESQAGEEDLVHQRESEESEGTGFDGGLLEHVRVVTSLIEGRRVGRDEIVELLRRVMRQRSIVRERRVDYVVRTLKEEPP
jgi:hypothetical protein